ncbi:MAG: DUF4214 domain-containing protein [Saccharofermentans sp.]|nr:DUF4214 domain-containing protein [Saccharofermentans sp.]
MKSRKIVSVLLAFIIMASGFAGVPRQAVKVNADEIPVVEEEDSEEAINEDESESDPAQTESEAVAEREADMEVESDGDTLAVDEDGVKGFVTRLYNVCLDRGPDAVGLEAWSDALIKKDATGCSVAFGFIFSDEFQNKGLSNTEYVTALYNAFFGREPDPAGLQSWVDLLDNGTSREAVFCGFTNSLEFSLLCDEYGIFRGIHVEGYNYYSVGRVNIFIDNLYNDVLGRPSDPGGLYSWTELLVSHKMTAYDAGKNFVLSSEFDNRHVCSDCYTDILIKAFGTTDDPYGNNRHLRSTLFRNYEYDWGYDYVTNKDAFKKMCDYYGIECGAKYDGWGHYGTNGNCSKCGSTLTYDKFIDASSVPVTGPDNLVYREGHSASLAPVVNPLDYTYEVIPLTGNLNGLFYIKTENPDPWSFSLFDNETIYADASAYGYNGHITPITACFSDVVYENEHTGRVKGGYIACSGYSVMGLSSGMRRLDIDLLIDDAPHYYPITDGGKLQLFVTNTYTFSAPYDDGKGNIWNPDRRVRMYLDETDVYVNCPKVVDNVDYLIQTYGNPGADFFDNLTAIQAGLGKIAVYPAGVVDDYHPTAFYPCYGVSPLYPEQSINAHSNIYPSVIGESFLTFATPFVLQSESFPDTMGKVAKRLEPTCTVERAGLHWLRNITFNGVTKSYGGQGVGGADSYIYLSKLHKNFTFDGSSSDMGLNGSVAKLREEYINVRAESDKDMKVLREMLNLKSVYQSENKGGWITVALEGSNSRTIRYAYYCTVQLSVIMSSTSSLENVWVDGRYINKFNYYEDMTFEDSMANKPSIVENGRMYCYVEASDCWVWSEYTNKDISTLPEDYVLTREEVAALNIDRNHDKNPEHGFIYDGTQKPGTPF